MKNELKNLFIKYKEIILYVIFGVLTTLANFVAFWISTRLLGEDLYLLNNAIAWVVGVAVAFVTNKIWVFNSKSWALKATMKELSEFVVARLLSFGFEEAGMWLFIDILAFGEKSLTILGFVISGQIIVKLLLSVIVVILNYFFSKFVIFKNKIA